MKRAHRKLSVVIPAAAMFVLALLTFAGPALASTVINGAGATFPMPLYYQWEHSYYSYTHKAVQVNYQGIGSGGGIDLLTALSAMRPRLLASWDFLGDVIPGLVPHTARSSLLLVAIALLLTSRGLRRGSRLALGASVLVVLVSLVLHLLPRQTEILPAVLTLIGAGWLVLERASFPVLPSRQSVRRVAVVGLLGVLLLVALAATLAMIAAHDPHPLADQRIRHVGRIVEYALLVGFVIALGWSLLSPRRPVHLGGHGHRIERERARSVIQRFGGGTLDYFALRDDKDWFFVGQSVVAHSVRAGVCLVSPDPIGPAEEREQTWAEFLDYAHDCGWSVAVIGASTPWLAVYEASGLRAVYLGDEAIVDCPSFTLAGGERKSLRQAVNRVAKGGWTTTFVDPLELDDGCRAQVLAMGGESRHGEGERGFSMTLSRMFDPDDTGLLLRKPQTDAETIASQTVVIEAIAAMMQANKSSSSSSTPMDAEAIAAMMQAGKKPGGNTSGGTPDHDTQRFGGPGTGNSGDPRRVRQSGGVDAASLPLEYRDVMQDYFRAADDAVKTTAGGKKP